MESTNNLLRIENTDNKSFSKQGKHKYSADPVSRFSLDHSINVTYKSLDDELIDEGALVNDIPMFTSRFNLAKIKGRKINPDDNKIFSW